MTLSPNTILVGRYRLGRELGRGTHSTVYLAEDLGRGGELVALKLTRSEKEGYAFFESAARVLHWFRHPNWADVRDAGVVPHPRLKPKTDAEKAERRELPSDTWFQVQRYVRGHSLEELEGPQPIELVQRFLEQGARVLQAIHDRGLIHYDVTPANVILEETRDGPTFVLTDGALANEGAVRGHGRGTALFMAPEVTELGPHDHRIDLYSLGLIAYRLLTGEDALGAKGEDPAEIVSRRRTSKAPRPSAIRSETPEALDAIVTALVDPMPGARPSSGRAVLRLLDQAGDEPIPEVTMLEAMARAEHGPTVGQQTALNRFETACSRLAYGLTSSAKGVDAGMTFVITGDPGSGRSRLLLNLEHAARLNELTVLWVAGESPESVSAAPLGLLVKGMNALLGTAESAQDWVRSRPPGRRIEDFLELALKLADRTSIVLIVEDYPSLGPLAREMIAALARELQGRHEHRAEVPPRLLLAIDAGSEDTDALTLPDVANPSAPLVSVERLGTRTLDEFLASRYSGITLDTEGAARLVAHTDGNASALISVLSQGFCPDAVPDDRHPGLRVEDGSWSIDEEALLAMDTSARLSPALERALAQADPVTARLILALSLLQSDLTADAARKIASLPSSAELPRSPLLVGKLRGDQEYVGLVRRAVGATLRAKTTEAALQDVQISTLAALQQAPTPDNRLDRIGLLVELGRHGDAITAFATEDPRLPGESTRFLLPYILRAVQNSRVLEHDADLRHGLATRIVSGEGALEIAQVLEPLCTREDAVRGTSLAIAEILEQAGQMDDALDCLERAAGNSDLPQNAYHELRIHQARVASGCLRRDQAGRILGDMARSIQRPRDWMDREARRLYALYLSECARLTFSKSHEHAREQFNEARRFVRGTRSAKEHARILNNLGIALETLGELDQSRRAFRNSLRLKRALGDSAGEVATNHNLARVHRRAGRLHEAITYAEQATSLAQRHRLDAYRITSLRELARVHDVSRRPDLAYPTLCRAWRALKSTSTSATHAAVALHLGPLAATFGDFRVCSDVLLQSARSMRTARRDRGRRSPAASVAWRSHYLTVAGSMLAAGNRQRFVVAVERVVRRALAEPHALPPTHCEEVNRLGSLARAYSSRTVRTLPEEGARDLLEPGSKELRQTADWFQQDVLAHPVSAPQFTGDVRSSLFPGESGRQTAEILLAACWTRDIPQRTEILVELESYARSNGFRFLLSRVLLSRAALDDGEAGQHKALQFSRGVDLLDSSSGGTLRATTSLPYEAQAAVKALRNTFTISAYAPANADELHAIAHKLILLKGAGSAPDSRLADALRRTLEASTKVRAGASLKDLLSMLTRHTIDITGAQRAYVLVFEEGSTEKVGQSTWEDDAETPVDQDRLVTTVIEKVVETGEPFWTVNPLISRNAADTTSSVSEVALELTSVLCVPILRGTRMLGVLYADTRMRAFAFDQDAREVLQLFAEQAGAAIESQRLVENVQQQLRDLQSMQEKLVHGERLRVIGELSSGVAHEFNNHLQTMLARIHNMHLNDLCGRAAEDLRLIQKSAEDATEIVRRLQGHSRRQRQQNYEVLRAGDFCQDALDLLRPLWRSSAGPLCGGIHVTFRADEDLWVRGNGPELREVITNVVKNALDALGGRGTIQVTAGRRQGRVYIRVEDDGPGIPADVVDQVCEAFFTTKGELGTGLGLCLSQQIVERHGGSLSVRSEEGHGTAIHIDLPAYGTGSTRPISRQPSDGRSAPPNRDTRQLRVLVVDDEDDVRASVVTYLRRTGNVVEGASSGSEALDVVSEQGFDVVLSDVNMPGMNGLDLCRALREARPGLPVVLMSGHADALGLDGSGDCGAVAVLTKPLIFSELGVTLRSFVPSS